MKFKDIILKNNNDIAVELYTHIIPMMMTFSMKAITDRALPDVRDGFKPIIRKILYAMYNNGQLSSKPFVKSSNAVSETMKIHNHGDSSIYGAIALLTDKNETCLHPYLEGDGQFGKSYNTDKPAQMRYTSVRLNKFTEDCILKNINKGAVDFITTSDHKQPVFLPTMFCNALVKSNLGIAIGMATNIPSFNLKEVNDLTIKILKHETYDEILIPDFPDGGNYIYNENELVKLFNTGYGKFVIRSKWRFDEKDNVIEVYEIPYSTTANAIIQKVTNLIKLGKIKEVLDIRDETGYDKKLKRECLKIAIDIKKSANPNDVMNKLFALTPLEDNYNANMNMLVNGTPRVLGVKDVILEWLKHRKTVIKSELRIERKELLTSYELMTGLLSIMDIIEEVIATIKTSKSQVETIENLKEKFNLSQQVAEYVYNIKLGNLNEEWIINKTKESNSIKDRIDEIENILKDESKVSNIIIEQLEWVNNKYSQPRKTQIIQSCVEDVDLVEDYNCQLVVTKEGYIKKTLRYSTNQKLKDGDTVEEQFQTTNKSKILAFTNLGNCYFYNTYDLNDTQPSNLGQYLPSLISLESDEKIIYTTVTSDFTGHLLFAYENGKVAKITLSSYKTETNRKRIKNAYNLNSKLVNVLKLTKDEDVMIKSVDNRYMVFNTSLLSEKQSTKSQGVNVISIKKGVVDKFEINQLCLAETGECWSDKIPKAGKKLDL